MSIQRWGDLWSLQRDEGGGHLRVRACLDLHGGLRIAAAQLLVCLRREGARRVARALAVRPMCTAGSLASTQPPGRDTSTVKQAVSWCAQDKHAVPQTHAERVHVLAATRLPSACIRHLSAC